MKDIPYLGMSGKEHHVHLGTSYMADFQAFLFSSLSVPSEAVSFSASKQIFPMESTYRRFHRIFVTIQSCYAIVYPVKEEWVEHKMCDGALSFIAPSLPAVAR